VLAVYSVRQSADNRRTGAKLGVLRLRRWGGSRSATNFEFRRRSASVHSRNSMTATSLGRTIFSASKISPHLARPVSGKCTDSCAYLTVHTLRISAPAPAATGPYKGSQVNPITVARVRASRQWFHSHVIGADSKLLRAKETLLISRHSTRLIGQRVVRCNFRVGNDSSAAVARNALKSCSNSRRLSGGVSRAKQ
jgi:hypothetical protein